MSPAACCEAWESCRKSGSCWRSTPGRRRPGQSAPFRGKLTGVGVGPGDPELLTYKAMKHIQNCDLLVLPDSDRGNCVAYQIVEKAWAGVRNQARFAGGHAMTHDKARMAESHLAAARAVERHLDQGKQVVFLTLGILPYIPRISISTGKLQRTATKRRWYPACPLFARRRLNWAGVWAWGRR